jgi:hypothetical protein
MRRLFVRQAPSDPRRGSVFLGRSRFNSQPLPADLVEAMANYLNNSTDLAEQIPGGFWADSAPDGTPFPYGVIVELSEAAGYSTSDGAGIPYIDDGQIQISLFAEGGKATARTLGLAVEEALDDVNLTFAGGYLMNLRRLSRTTLLDPTPGPNGGDVWARILTLITTVGRTL